MKKNIQASRISNRTETSKTQVKPIPAKNNSKHFAFPNASNQEMLRRSLRLLGVTSQIYEKETKSVLDGEFFPKNLPNPSNSKQFFFITQLCMKALTSVEEGQQLMMWYPPRTVNEQIQFKKALFKLLQKQQTRGVVPKSLIISKMTIMGDSPASALLQFLRTLAELSLRAVYIDRYSKEEGLIQLSVNDSNCTFGENDINRFYVFPFCDTSTTVDPPIQSQVEMGSLKRLYQAYIERYRKKILSLRTSEQSQLLNPQQLMSQLMEQRQLAETLSSKVNKTVYSQNRAFDRRIILDKNQQIWKELDALECNFLDSTEATILRLEGETAKLLASWKVASGTHCLVDHNVQTDKLESLRRKCKQRLQELEQLQKQLLRAIE